MIVNISMFNLRGLQWASLPSRGACYCGCSAFQPWARLSDEGAGFRFTPYSLFSGQE